MKVKGERMAARSEGPAFSRTAANHDSPPAAGCSPGNRDTKLPTKFIVPRNAFGLESLERQKR